MIGLLTVSIPLLTAHLCLGATNLFDAFKNSIDQGANRFGLMRAGVRAGNPEGLGRRSEIINGSESAV